MRNTKKRERLVNYRHHKSENEGLEKIEREDDNEESERNPFWKGAHKMKLKKLMNRIS